MKYYSLEMTVFSPSGIMEKTMFNEVVLSSEIRAMVTIYTGIVKIGLRSALWECVLLFSLNRKVALLQESKHSGNPQGDGRNIDYQGQDDELHQDKRPERFDQFTQFEAADDHAHEQAGTHGRGHQGDIQVNAHHNPEMQRMHPRLIARGARIGPRINSAGPISKNIPTRIKNRLHSSRMTYLLLLRAINTWATISGIC